MPRTAHMKPVLRRKGRPMPWCVSVAASISDTGKRKDKWFPTREKADSFIKDEERRLREYTDKARGMTDAEKIDAAAALVIAKANGFTVLAAVHEKAASVQMANASATVERMIDESVAQLRRENKSARHVNEAKHVGGKVKQAFAGKIACDITTLDLQTWLDSLSPLLSPNTLRKFRRYLSLFFENARLRHGWIKVNPVKDIRLRYQSDNEGVTILTPEQVETLLRVADDKIKPYIALLAFAGLRPSEAQKLEWRNVGVTNGVRRLYVEAASAKTRRHRYVTLPDNLMSWLRIELGAKVCYSRRLFREAVEKAGLTPWPPDALRHSFGSYWLALHNDENKLAQEMGNSPSIIVLHYRRPVSKEAAERYFSIVP